jgi:hypothetical protein
MARRQVPLPFSVTDMYLAAMLDELREIRDEMGALRAERPPAPEQILDADTGSDVSVVQDVVPARKASRFARQSKP